MTSLTMSDKQSKLLRFKTRASRYEIVLIAPSGETHLVRYTPRRTFQGLYNCVRDAWMRIQIVTGVSEPWTIRDTFGGKQRNAATSLISQGWTVRFSGRTQREAICTTEHQFIGVDARTLTEGGAA